MKKVRNSPAQAPSNAKNVLGLLKKSVEFLGLVVGIGNEDSQDEPAHREAK